MMASNNLLSRLLPSADDQQAPDSRASSTLPPYRDIEAQPSVDIDEENLGARFQEQDLDHLLADAAESDVMSQTSTSPTDQHQASRNARPPHPSQHAQQQSKRSQPKRTRSAGVDEEDDDVPQSLLLEDKAKAKDASTKHVRSRSRNVPGPVRGRAPRDTTEQWNTARAQQQLYNDMPRGPLSTGRPTMSKPDPKQEALWYWANIHDLDAFFHEVYNYWLGHGMYAIILKRLLDLLKFAFVVGFTTFLTFCVDYSKLSHSKALSDLVQKKCFRTKIHGIWVLLLWILCVVWLYLLVLHIASIRKLRRIHDFYHHLLEIPERDIQTVSWQHVVSRLMTLRDSNVLTAQNITPANRKYTEAHSKQRMDAVDIANRLMRKENYTIALYNKDILDVNVPIPFLGNRQMVSKTTDYAFRFCVLDYVFDNNGQVNERFLTVSQRAHLIETLKRRCIVAGYISFIATPFVMIYVLVSYFLQFFNDYKKEPGQLSFRMFTPLAQWKFREFNELVHIFKLRRNHAYQFADDYVNSFPTDKTDQVKTFAAFISGSILSVIAIATVFDAELFLGVHVTNGTTVLTWIAILTGVYNFARGSSPVQNQEPSTEPSAALELVIGLIHYCPVHWKDRLHSDEVRQEFTSLYQLKVVMFFEELLSLLVTPYILLYRLPRCSESIVDFFREFTINVDGLGNVCSYAVFDFQKDKDNIAHNKSSNDQDEAGLRADYYAAKHDKLAMSYYGFMDQYYTNPSKHRRHHRQMSFYPPPNFSLHNLQEPITQQALKQPPAARASQDTLRPNPTKGPTHSPLLDPHHQPSPTAMRNSQMLTSQMRSRYRSPSARQPAVPEEVTTSRIIEEDSHLGESWNLKKDQEQEEEQVDEGEDQAPGVLGLLYQFSKRETQGRGGLLH